MKVTASSGFNILSRLRTYFDGDFSNRHYSGEAPFRSELYSSGQMDRHSKAVARAHKLSEKKKSPDQLLKRLVDNEHTLLEVRNLLLETLKSGKAISPGGEWLLDNFYLIEEQIAIARKHLPKGYSEGLPYLAEGTSAGLPRVYDIVLEIISHSDGRVDVKSLTSFIASYQTVSLLTLGELWAIPIMLRLAVIENLRRVAGMIALDMIDHNLADYWADEMTLTVKEDPGNLILTIADMVRSKPVLASPFVASFVRSLQGKGPALALPLSWMEQQLASMGTSSADLVRLENQKQAADQVSVSNSIGTLRFLSATDWRDFVESLSAVEAVLRQDKTGVYPLMDFATRDRYRHVVEGIAKHTTVSEKEVAAQAIALTQRHNIEDREAHIGYYLIDEGRILTEEAVRMRSSFRLRVMRFGKKMPLTLYLLSIFFISVGVTGGMTWMAWQEGVHRWLLAATIVLSFAGAGQLAVSMVNWLATIRILPNLLPKMDFSKGIPAVNRTLVVVPTMLSSVDYIEELVEALEIRYLANRETNVHYGLLTDFTDSNTKTRPEDEMLLAVASGRIETLNQKYSGEEDIFFLFHRPRLWNPSEQQWMGYERKRGKLAALNALLRRRNKDEFSHITGRHEILQQVRYVITLDSDTQLPRESVWKFVATMAHPLNTPIYDPAKKLVVHGYGILQPRIASSMPTATPTLYLKMQGDVAGIDPYTRVSSDVYQDLFKEGSFIGKGIYDVDMFEQALHQVFPENRILSHDLIEGCYVRSGLLSDVLLYEENPDQYAADVKRHHRWIRGDWQIASWMLPWYRNSTGKLVKNHLSGLSRWKIFDNLRRSLLPPALLLLLVLGWTALPLPWFWTLSVTIMILLPVMTAAGWQLFHKPDEVSFVAHLSEVLVSVRNALMRFVFGLAVLPYEAYKYIDAIIRTNWRMIISKRKLLEWTPSATAARSTKKDVVSAYITMWITPLTAIAGLIILWDHPMVIGVSSPILILWLLAPAIAWKVSSPMADEATALPENELDFLHKAARKTWSYFEQFVNEEENWMPPDNYQEHPTAVIAHRTSPTNMGLALLANLAAYDFGYITGGELLSRTSNTLQSMLQLERYKGHFYNWYDTLSLQPLRPRYVSTVDSGNLAGHLLVLKQGLLSLPDAPVFSTKIFDGLRVTLSIVREYSKGESERTIRNIFSVLDAATLEERSLTKINQHIDELVMMIKELTREQVNSDMESFNWTFRLHRQMRRVKEELEQTIPWLNLLPVPGHLSKLNSLNKQPTLFSLYALADEILPVIDQYLQENNSEADKLWLENVKAAVGRTTHLATERITLVQQLTEHCEGLSDMEYDFLYDKQTSLLRIGYNVDEQRKDASYYDLLASEARLGIFVAISQGKLPQESWFALGRLLTDAGGEPVLLSWSGSMFEYLMPQLVMPSYENTLLYQTSKATVKRQIDYTAQRGIPWGISESGYNTVDAALNYQYRAFGVPGLGLKRGLEEDLVIAPYASMLALMVTPDKASANLMSMAAQGFEGTYGFFEAVDYTPSRLPRGKEHVIISSYMVHHQGMGFLAFAYILLNKPMQQRFAAELRFQATLMLLQERVPRTTLFYAHTADLLETHSPTADPVSVPIRSSNNPNSAVPEIHLLSNSSYQVMITNSGGGYSRWKNLAVTRWREDATRDDRGIFCYIKDVDTGKYWSNTYHPTLQEPKSYGAIFSGGHVEFHRHDYDIDTRTEIVISPEDDAEMRRIRITNKGQATKVFELTSYAEIVLASQASDEAHPAFSNLFVQTEILPDNKAIFCTRRARSGDETPPWMFHHMDVHGVTVESISCETDRMKFIGRGKTLINPEMLDQPQLSNTQGSVLDPIAAIRYCITVKPGQTAVIDLIFGVNETRAGCEQLMYKYRDQHLKRRAFELSFTHSQVLLRQINATEADAQLYDRLAAAVIYTNPALRADAGVIQSNHRGQSGLWSHSVSGDLPIILLHIYNTESVDLVKQLVQAHAYWRLKGLAVDLVIWNEDHGSYRQVLQEQILGLINTEIASSQTYSKPGSIFVKSADQISAEDRILFESVARIVISDHKGPLTEQVNRHYTRKAMLKLFDKKPEVINYPTKELYLPDDLVFFNGTGGFTPDGREYKILTNTNAATPAPWVNVIANPEFGTVISESGSAYTWATNAHEYRLTPWANDPVSDSGGEAFYVRDDESGAFWSPCPFPVRGVTSYITTHGFGYTSFEHAAQGLTTRLTVFVDKAKPVKFVHLKIKNASGRERKLSAMGFLEIILGDVRAKTNMHILSEYDAADNALLFRNHYNSAFTERVTYFKVDGPNLSYTTDRTEFIGRNRSLQNPQALSYKKLSGRTGAAMDACAALQVSFDLLDGDEQELIFQIGSAENTKAVHELIQYFADLDTVLQSLNDVQAYWREMIEKVQVQTPDPALNILANGWLTYQTMACRVMARSGFYQSGGAFGFRDQLQDVLALLHARPKLAREQILLNASRQFAEGDVQHWWHPPEGKGVRTKCSDDMLWLPYAVSRYISVTGDKSILQASVGFLECRLLHEGEDSLYDLPVSGTASGSLYEHCVRAIKHSLHFGQHGMPFIGSGDWNDGMDQVGHHGKGESVWLAFFLYDVLQRFVPVANGFGDDMFADRCLKEAATLQQHIEANGWDGAWYLRAWFDDGTPLGTKANEECQIDAIAQSWSVLSGAGDPARMITAMKSLDQHLVKRDLQLIQLLTPAFDKSPLNPGYIKGYVPGVRENGGQYSHAAIWALMAFARLGERDKVYELFSMIQPVNHALDAAAVSIYKVEPYVMAADVYANKQHEGRGGWTWYTGSAGWMYQFILGSLLGLELQTDRLHFKPCFPLSWPFVTINYRFGATLYKITVFQLNSDIGSWWKMDYDRGVGAIIPLKDDGGVHEVELHVSILTG